MYQVVYLIFQLFLSSKLVFQSFQFVCHLSEFGVAVFFISRKLELKKYGIITSSLR